MITTRSAVNIEAHELDHGADWNVPVNFIRLALVAVVLACAPADDTVDTIDAAAPAAADTPTSAPDSGDAGVALGFPRDSGTAGVTQRPPGPIPPVILRDVRTATHAEFDRVVFAFDGSDLPGYHIEYVDRPVVQCGSGDPVPVAGDAWLAVRIEPANAHEGDTTMVATIRDRNRTLTLPNLRQLVLTCDFEAQVEWVLGLRSPNRYRVLELTNPTRLVVDVRR